ncbi:MAG: transposase [Candidatus Brocadia sp.]|nr:transposase [Candidatus Brocadia sp.]
MAYDPKIHHRRSIRLKEYDYSRNGAYFITVCVYDKKCIFGKIINESVELTHIGKMVNDFWYEIPNHFKNVILDTFIVMPNHIHGIIIITGDCMDAVSTPPNINIDNGRDGVSPPKWKRTLGQIIGYYKYQTTKIINQMNKTAGDHLWQRNYYDHIIRNVDNLNKIREYIIQNPLKWALDRENPENVK